MNSRFARPGRPLIVCIAEFDRTYCHVLESLVNDGHEFRCIGMLVSGALGLLKNRFRGDSYLQTT